MALGLHFELSPVAFRVRRIAARVESATIGLVTRRSLGMLAIAAGPVLSAFACGSFGSAADDTTADASEAATEDAANDTAAQDAAADETAAPGDAAVFGVRCGTVVCRGQESCCYDPSTNTSACVGAGQACSDAGLQYFCDDHADCEALGHAEFRCCASYYFTSTSGWGQVAIPSSASCALNCASSAFTRCAPNSTDCAALDAGASCVPATTHASTNATILPGIYFECR
jgi:hypothetical protein